MRGVRVCRDVEIRGEKNRKGTVRGRATGGFMNGRGRQEQE